MKTLNNIERAIQKLMKEQEEIQNQIKYLQEQAAPAKALNMWKVQYEDYIQKRLEDYSVTTENKRNVTLATYIKAIMRLRLDGYDGREWTSTHIKNKSDFDRIIEQIDAILPAKRTDCEDCYAQG